MEVFQVCVGIRRPVCSGGTAQSQSSLNDSSLSRSSYRCRGRPVESNHYVGGRDVAWCSMPPRQLTCDLANCHSDLRSGAAMAKACPRSFKAPDAYDKDTT